MAINLQAKIQKMKRQTKRPKAQPQRPIYRRPPQPTVSEREAEFKAVQLNLLYDATRFIAAAQCYYCGEIIHWPILDVVDSRAALRTTMWDKGWRVTIAKGVGEVAICPICLERSLDSQRKMPPTS